jgi:tRNA-splicing ligase RtcB (3'-phosphate/5'-hydroxy nucleic acid ligase)
VPPSDITKDQVVVVDENRLRIPKDGVPGMRVDGLIFVKSNQLDSLVRERVLTQVANVAHLPGILGASIAMPDIHYGYGFPIGGVAATDLNDGVISPGGVGYDINCGVRLLSTGICYDEVKDKVRPLVDTLFGLVPAGVGGRGAGVSRDELREIAVKGAAWLKGKGLVTDGDLLRMESRGTFPGGEPEAVSDQAFARGAGQIGTLGAGNHFLEFQVAEEVFERETARAFGLTVERELCVMIHTGSRGFGHQICDDYLSLMEEAVRKYHIDLPDRQLACAPTQSEEAQSYLKAMACGANFAWTNRSVITARVRDAFTKVFGDEEAGKRVRLVWDVSHNMAKPETHRFGGEDRKVMVHRKGATRAFGPHSADLPDDLAAIGQPVLIPGDMGRASYLLVGTDRAMAETFGSTCHGAGRIRSRTAAAREFNAPDVVKDLAARGIYVRGASSRVIAEEAPLAYKDVSMVVDVMASVGVSRKVVRMKPVGVMKG